MPDTVSMKNLRTRRRPYMIAALIIAAALRLALLGLKPAHFDEGVTGWLIAVSPALVFYGRYAIHETWLVFFLMLAAWGWLGLRHFGEKKYLWATAAGLTGMIVTKETYFIHLVCFALALAFLKLWERL